MPLESPTPPGDDTSKLDGAWRQVIANLFADSSISPRQKGTLRLAAPRALVGSEMVVMVTKDDVTKRQLEGPLRDRLAAEFSEALGFPVAFAFAVDPALEVELPEEPAASAAPPSPTGSSQVSSASAQAHPQPSPYGPEEHAPETPADLPVSRISPPEGLPQQSEDAAFAAAPPDTSGLMGRQGASSAGQQVSHRMPAKEAQDGDPLAELNPKYTFETFVIGASNRFPNAAAVAVAEAPAKAYNPLFIYGESGLGKTHLLHAIGHYASVLYPGIRVKYVSSEEFVNDFINSIGNSTTSNQLRPSFQRRYREVDILLIDDIQFLQGKDATVEEFFHTFNALHNEQKQVVITSDLPPKQLQGFEERLRSRFEWGLLADVQPPDLETRIAILRRKAQAEQLDVPGDVLEYIASRISSNIRELEGALIRVTAFANLNRQPVDLTIAQTVLKDFITEEEAPEITASTIIMMTANYFNLSYDDLCGTSRSRTLTTARQIAMYLCRELTDLSLPKIGQEFGGRDHTTVMHANKKIRTQMAERRTTYTQVTELTNRIKQQHKI
ncbi:chromosomal replication initiator protein DnaA [Sediminivirga luteola]|uniref:Chromosomal replication initiator protein DnaA n=1 Tax=Sediminivirga luteola TaxID=1774748 RepID=A0A8J2TZI2_9MICO|nr:chromosomal replication initiator protein DnaA [Sediminivirga luteola]MCI2266628.1 chromosomal replication initiator protein DnaA [Sediminivirga luteola]GGA20183.1 hypothetical protein GCM10011333_24170 [Sediminivirga luteola]